MDKLSVVILNYNGKHHLENFLPSVLEYTNYPIIVADNCSTDDSIAFLQTHYPTIRLIQLQKNHGFAGGYNLALEQVNSEYYILLNSDVAVSPAWADTLLETIEQDKNTAAVQPKILSYVNEGYFDYAGAGGGYLDKWGYPFCRGRIFDTIEKDQGQYDDYQEVFWASGACMIIRAECFHKSGGFNAGFFAHMEEIDLCWRLQKSGYKIAYQGASTVYHLGGGTLAAESPFKTYLNFRNSLLMLNNNLSGFRKLKTILIRLILDLPAFLRYFVQGKWRNAVSIPKAHFAFYARLLKPTKLTMLVGDSEVKLFEKSVVNLYFFKGKKKYSDLI